MYGVFLSRWHASNMEVMVVAVNDVSDWAWNAIYQLIYSEATTASECPYVILLSFRTRWTFPVHRKHGDVYVIVNISSESVD